MPSAHHHRRSPPIDELFLSKWTFSKALDLFSSNPSLVFSVIAPKHLDLSFKLAAKNLKSPSSASLLASKFEYVYLLISNVIFPTKLPPETSFYTKPLMLFILLLLGLFGFLADSFLYTGNVWFLFLFICMGRVWDNKVRLCFLECGCLGFFFYFLSRSENEGVLVLLFLVRLFFFKSQCLF